MRALVALAALTLFSCAARPLIADAPPPQVAAVAVEFTSREKGQLEFTLVLPADSGTPRFITWELLVGGARLAAGIEGEVTVVDGRCVVKTPLASRHLEWKDGATTTQVLLRGTVDFGNPDARRSFRELREVTMNGVPRLNVPNE